MALALPGLGGWGEGPAGICPQPSGSHRTVSSGCGQELEKMADPSAPPRPPISPPPGL